MPVYTQDQLRVMLDQEPRRILSDPEGFGKRLTAGYLVLELRLAPAWESGVMNTCVVASPGCAASCLYWTHRTEPAAGMELSDQLAGRIRKTRFFHRQPEVFARRLAGDIGKWAKSAALQGQQLVVRLNCTSDIRWERYATEWRRQKVPNISGPNVMSIFQDVGFVDADGEVVEHGDVVFYDYTKHRITKRDTSIRNYHLTFSLSETNSAYAREALEMGINVAVVFGGAEIKRRKYSGSLPEEWTIDGLTRPVINHKESYARFLDAKSTPGYIVALRASHRALHDRTGFVVWLS